MSCKLYANIGIGHENDIDVLKSRIVNAAHCNADAVVLSKSTPFIVIPKEKKYVSINSKWGNLPYIEVANRSEVSKENAKELTDYCNKIGIPIIWSVTDSTSAEFIKEHCGAETIKIHFDCVDPYELTRYCATNFKHIIYPYTVIEDVIAIHGKKYREFTLYHTTKNFNPDISELNLNNINEFLRQHFTVGYEGKESGIFPTMAVAYKGVDYIEKYLGEQQSDNPSILTPDQFYDLWNSLKLMTDADSHQEPI